MADQKHLTGHCPNCSAKVEYLESDTTVTCNCCDSTFNVSELQAQGTKAHDTAARAALVAQSIDSAESGLAYLESFFETYDWDEYLNNTSIQIEEITEMIEKIKIKNANNPIAWELEFTSLYTPLVHKINGLRELAKHMAEDYNGLDNTLLYDELDLYSLITESLIENTDYILKVLGVDVRFAKRYGAPTAKVAELEGYVANVTEALNSLTPVTEFKEIPEIAAKIEVINEELIKSFEEKGINCEEVYEEAVRKYTERTDINGALEAFHTINGYKDSYKYILDINRYFSYDGKVIVMLDRKFTLTEDKRKIEADKKNKLKTVADQEVDAGTFSIREIENLKPSSTALVRNVLQVITHYGENLYFVRRLFEKKTVKDQIISYNIVSNTEKVLNEGKEGCYDKAVYYHNKKGDVLYFQKSLSAKVEEKKGCFGPKVEVTPTKAQISGNGYELLALDLLNCECTVAIQGVTAVEKVCENLIFFIRSKRVAKVANKGTPKAHAPVPSAAAAKAPVAKKPAPQQPANTTKLPTPTILEYLQYDMDTKEVKNLLGEDCVVETVVNNHIIYTTYDPTKLNNTLWSLDMDTLQKEIIEKNVFEFFADIDGLIYYTVGNATFKSLFSNNFDGTARHEVMRNTTAINAIIGNWLYIIKGVGSGSVLMKVSKDGSEQVYICTGIKYTVKITPDFIYYVDAYGYLHYVRQDGNNDKIIASHIKADSKVIIDDEHIFYLRYEETADEKQVITKGLDVDPTTNAPVTNNGCKAGCGGNASSKTTPYATAPANNSKASNGGCSGAKAVETLNITKVKEVEYAYSLYMIDLDGHNVRKLAFDIEDTREAIGTDWIYYKKVEETPFEVRTHVTKTQIDRKVQSFKVSKYFRINKKTLEVEPIVTAGLPSGPALGEKSGCSGKQKELKVDYVELPNKPKYRQAAFEKVTTK